MIATQDRTERRTIGALKAYLASLVHSTEFDYIVPVERKGTALVRSAVGPGDAGVWRKVFAADTLAGRPEVRRPASILVIDDSVFLGATLQRTLGPVREHWPGAAVTVAVFSTHRKAPPGIAHRTYYSGLDDDEFGAVRRAVVRHLQQEGSLLLDTEHLEFTVSVKGPLEPFWDALAGWGEAVRFAPAPDRVNLTIEQRSGHVIELVREAAPSFADLADGFCKLRVVSQPAAHTFSLIPICYPAIRGTAASVYDYPGMPWTRSVRGIERLFHCVGVTLSMVVVADVISWLQNALGDTFQVDLGTGGLEHIRSVLPELQPEQVVNEVRRRLAKTRERSTRVAPVDDPGMRILGELGERILLDCYDPNSTEKRFLRSRSMKDVLRIASMTEHPHARASAALDALIDQAAILPTTLITDDAGLITARRAFVPDGELVGRDVIRAALSLGKGFVIGEPKH